MSLECFLLTALRCFSYLSLLTLLCLTEICDNGEISFRYLQLARKIYKTIRGHIHVAYCIYVAESSSSINYFCRFNKQMPTLCLCVYVFSDGEVDIKAASDHLMAVYYRHLMAVYFRHYL